MEATTESRRKRTVSSSAEDGENGLFNSFCLATLAFLAVMLTHQFMLGAMSWYLDYDTHIMFSKVDSMPYDNRYWSSNRVIVLYAFPSFFFLASVILLVFFMLYNVKRINGFVRFCFWWMVFSLLLITTQVGIAPLATALGKGQIYQGIPVVLRWYGITSDWLIGLSVLSVFINLVFGFISFRILMQLAPFQSELKDKAGKSRAIRNFYLLPMLYLFPIAMLLAYPNSFLFFSVMFFLSLFWLPGLYMKSYDGGRYKRGKLRIKEIKTGYILPIIIVTLVVLVRIFLGGHE